MYGKGALRTAEIANAKRAAAPLPDGPVQVETHLIWNSQHVDLHSAIRRASSFRYTLLKRAIDIVLSLILLVLCLPLGLVIASLIVLTSPGPVFYMQERIGRFGVPFRILKFRSMYAQAQRGEVLDISRRYRGPHYNPAEAKSPTDPRVTPFGRLIRKLSLDELPQILNVLAGKMSLVGPRPIVEAERPIYGPYLAYYDLCSPGITGLWQVSGRSDVGYERRVMFDRDYATQWSCRLDFIILARTVPAVLKMRGAY